LKRLFTAAADDRTNSTSLKALAHLWSSMARPLPSNWIAIKAQFFFFCLFIYLFIYFFLTKLTAHFPCRIASFFWLHILLNKFCQGQ